MSAVRIGVGSAVVALAAAGVLSHLSPPERALLLDDVRGALGLVSPAPAAAPAAPGAARSPVAITSDRGGTAETLAADGAGQFHALVEVEGTRLPVLVDTGATYVALRYEDADRLGVRPTPADFRLPVGTANGRTFAAAVTLPAIRLGSIEVRNVPALVTQRGQLGTTLLGMSFLSRLSSLRVERGQLVLVP